MREAVLLPLRVYHPSFGLPIVNALLLAANLMAFFYLSALPSEEAGSIMTLYGAVPLEIWQGENLWSVLTGMFVHDINRTAHIVFNMLTLAIFGGNIEGELGHFRYLVFYMLGGLLASLAHISAWPEQGEALVGASGAISAVMGGYLVIHPRHPVLFFVPFLGLYRQPVLIYMIIWLAVQIVIGLRPADHHIAWFAHLGGFVAGVVLVRPVQTASFRSLRLRFRFTAPESARQDGEPIL